jgi:hypothetical protein
LARGRLDRLDRLFDLPQKNSWQVPEHRVNVKTLARSVGSNSRRLSSCRSKMFATTSWIVTANDLERFERGFR